MHVIVEKDVAATMRDGVVLRADIYRPHDRGPWPVLLARLPYDKSSRAIKSRFDPVEISSQGFIVVLQDTRGRYRSDGEWEPFTAEACDGYDTVEWAARLPDSNGRVGMFGGTYLGNAQWLAAIAGPPSLAAITPAFTWSDPDDGFYRRGGATELGVLLALVAGDQRRLRTSKRRLQSAGLRRADGGTNCRVGSSTVLGICATVLARRGHSQ